MAEEGETTSRGSEPEEATQESDEQKKKKTSFTSAMKPWKQHAGVITMPCFDYNAPSPFLQQSHSDFLITSTIKREREKSPTKEAMSILGKVQNHTKRGKSFTNNQDVAICSAWLAITQDHVVGNLQTSHNNFWDRVLENYTIHADDQSARTKASIQSRWGTIMRSCNKFREYLSQIENRQQSGVITEVDMVLQAKLLYIEIEKKKFTFDHCWDVLKRGSQWHDLAMRNKRNRTIRDTNDLPHPSSPSQVLETPNSQDSNHLPFENDEKESWKKNKLVDASSTRFCDMIFELNKQTSEAQERKARVKERELQILEEANERERRKAEMELKIMMEKNEREQREKDDKIMLMDTSDMDSRTRAYFEHRKAQIFAKIDHPAD